MSKIQTATYETFACSPYAGCWLSWCLHSPIDFGWDLLQPATAAAEFMAGTYHGSEDRTKLLNQAAYLGAFFQIVANNSYAELSDMCEWRVIALPIGDNTVEIRGFTWKVSNNGSTFITLRQKHAADIDTMCSADERTDMGLFTVYAQNQKSRAREASSCR
jgi:hypothetical protein